VPTDKRPKRKKKVQKPTPPVDSPVPDFGGLPMRDLKKNLGCG
jgi:hypothetical protein